MYSSLVSYVKISPNRNVRKNAFYNPTGRICKITPHHQAGKGSIEAMGAQFTQGGASANYGIGTDGRIACYVEEEYRAFTSSSKENDYMAITIEVANCGGAPDWPISDAAYKSLVELCADICSRHGFSLDFTGDKHGSLTMHKYFVPTLCPGPYLEGRFPQLVKDVNARLGDLPETAPEKESNNIKNEKPKEGYTMNMRIMQQGDSGEDVRALQILLKGNGYDLGDFGPKGDGVDSHYGPATARAVRKLEEDRDLDLDEGIAGKQVMASLLGR